MPDLDDRGGDVTSNRLVVHADTNGDVCCHTRRATDLVIDIDATIDGRAIDLQRSDTRAG